MLDLIAAASVGGIVGFGICAVLTAGKVADLERDVRLTRDVKVAEILPQANQIIAAEAKEARDAHTRCADALTCTQRKLSAIRDLLDTPQTIRKADLRDVLDGEQG